MKKAYFLLLMSVLIFACVQKEIAPLSTEKLDNSRLKGAGVFTFNGYAPLQQKPIKVYFHIPENATPSTPILIAFHGTDRSGLNTRNDLFDANNKFITLAPEFDDVQFQGGDAYNLGNVFMDGDNPSANTLNAESLWTFSLIEPLFEYVKNTLQSKVKTYDIFGHSAGAQFAHRLMLFKPNNQIQHAVFSAAGWYTLLDTSIQFPYGLGSSPAQQTNQSSFLQKSVWVMVGDKDTDPNSADLRHNDIVDQQGLNRMARANFYYNHARQLALKNKFDFNWNYSLLKNVAHDGRASAIAAKAILYP